MTARFASEIISPFFLNEGRHYTVINISGAEQFEPFELGGVGSDGCDLADHPEIPTRLVQPGSL
jgi:hypothetical protein